MKKTKSEKKYIRRIGDTPCDIEAAGRAGIETIAFTWIGGDRAPLKHAAAIYKGSTELPPSLTELSLS